MFLLKIALEMRRCVALRPVNGALRTLMEDESSVRIVTTLKEHASL